MVQSSLDDRTAVGDEMIYSHLFGLPKPAGEVYIMTGSGAHSFRVA